MTTTYDPEEFHRLSDMAAVTYLRMMGHESQDVIKENGTVYWIFRLSDALLDDIDSYQEDEARVSPRDFNRMYAVTRKDLFRMRDETSTSAA